MLKFSGWWLNQPPWKICSSKWQKNPQIGVKIKNIFELPLPSFVCFGNVPKTKIYVLTMFWVQPNFWLDQKKHKVWGLAPRFFVWSFLSVWFNKNPSTIKRRGLELLAKFILSSRKTNRSRMKDPQCQVEIPPRELTYPMGRRKSSSNMPYQGDENSLEGTSGYIFKWSIFHCHLRFTRG